ncbi:hypothetical protein [Rickettsia endosymbiont of Orchestes rusci]
MWMLLSAQNGVIPWSRRRCCFYRAMQQRRRDHGMTSSRLLIDS